MAGIVYIKLIDALKGIGVDVSQQSGSNVKILAPKNKSTATKPGLLASERDTGGNFATVLDIFKNEAKYIDSMNDAEQMAFLNNILDYNEFGGKSIGVSKGIEATDVMKDFKNTQSELKKALEDLQSTAEKNKNQALKDLDTFLETGGQPLKKKDDKFLGGSMHEEGQLRTGIRQFLQTEYKNGRLKLDDLDKERVMEYSPMIEHDPILVFKKIYGDEAYKKAGSFPGAFEIGENFKHYEEIFRNNMGEDILKVKDKKYVGDGKLVLTKQEEVFEPTPDDPDVPFAKGGRASFVGGKVVDELVAMIVKKEPIEAMKEVNKIIGKKGKYKNLTQKDIDRIVDQTNDHIFQRDPDNLYVYDDGKTVFDDDLTKEQLIEKEGRKLDQENMAGSADDMSFEDSIKEMEGLGATQTAERFRLKQKYPGITDDLLDKILIDDNPQRKAEVLATIDEAFRMMEKGKGTEEIIETFKNTTRTKNAKGGRIGFFGGGAGKYQMDLPFGKPLFTMVMNNKLFGIYQNKDGSRLSVPLGSDGKPSYAKGGRAGFYLGGQSGQSVIEPDLSDIGHGSDALMSRTRMLGPNSQATTSTGLNYLLGEDNDNTRIPFRFGGKGPGEIVQDEKKKLEQLKKMFDNLNMKRSPDGIIMDSPPPPLEGITTLDRPDIKDVDVMNLLDTTTPMFDKDNIVKYDDGTVYYKDTDQYVIFDEDGEPTELMGPSEGAKIIPKTVEVAEGGRIGFNDGLLVPKPKPYTTDMFEKDSMLLLKGMHGTGPESNPLFYNKIIEKGNKLRKQGVERETVIEIIRKNKDKIKAFLETQTTSPKNFEGLESFEMKANGGRIGFAGGGADMSTVADSKGNVGAKSVSVSPSGQVTTSRTQGPEGPDDKSSSDQNMVQMLVNQGYTPKEINSITNPTIIDHVKNSKYNNPFTRGILKTGAYIYNPTIAGVELKQLMQAKDLYNQTKDQIMNPEYGMEDLTFGVPTEYAKGGIASLRPGYAGGTLVDKGRRGFLKLLGVTAGGVAALKLGLGKILGKDSGAVSKKVIDEVIIDGGTGAPAWLQPLVNKALREGTDKTKGLAYKDAQTVKRLDTPTGQVDVYYDVRTGEVEIDYIGGNTALGESVNMRYTPGIADEGTKGKPADEFEATEAIPEYQGGNPLDGPSLEVGENITSDVKGLYSDTSELAELGGEKLLIKDISDSIKKKKVLKKMEDQPADFITDEVGIYDPT